MQNEDSWLLMYDYTWSYASQIKTHDDESLYSKVSVETHTNIQKWTAS